MSSVSESVPESPSFDDETQRSGRASRFFKRMSALGGPRKQRTTASSPQPSRRGSSITTTSDTYTHALSPEKEQRDVPPAVVIGDMNVQFPGSGLWKRRWVEIDDGGNLVFSAAGGRRFEMVSSTKRFPLVEFGRVFVPALDEQELAFSVVLEGRGRGAWAVQCAGEDGMAQRQLLHCEYLSAP